MRSLVCGLALLALAGCQDRPTALVDSPVVEFALVSGDGQVGPTGRELSEPLVVSALAPGGAPIQGQAVNFVVIQGGGSMFAGSAVTDAAGIATDR